MTLHLLIIENTEHLEYFLCGVEGGGVSALFEILNCENTFKELLQNLS